MGAERHRVFDWDEVLDESNYYELLGVLEIADEGAIQAAFHEFARAFHPDAHLGAEESVRGAARRVFQRGAEAYRVLSDPAARQRYDFALSRGQLRLGAREVPAANASVTGRRALEELVESPAARQRARRAEELIDQGDLAGAMRELKMARHYEGGATPDLDERIDALDLALFASGD
ncbi:MAG: J domain-containing protein [Polyangiaceae bacterium]|nr:J domain-containing protein [Polyangiaceae bacterium]